MKNSNDNNANETTLHELLCAYVFGELGPVESARIEEQLAQDPELRAEWARLEATIGLVTEHCSGSESLSLPALEALDREVDKETSTSGQPRRPSYWGAPLQAAAGFAALATGLLAGKLWMDQEGASTGELPTSEPLALFETVEAPKVPAALGGQLNQSGSNSTTVRVPVESVEEEPVMSDALVEAPSSNLGELAANVRPQNREAQTLERRKSAAQARQQESKQAVDESRSYRMATGEWKRPRTETATSQAPQVGTPAAEPVGTHAYVPRLELQASQTPFELNSVLSTETPTTSPYTWSMQPASQGANPQEPALFDLGLVLPATEPVQGRVAPYAQPPLIDTSNAWKIDFDELSAFGYVGEPPAEGALADNGGQDGFFLGHGAESRSRRAGMDLETLSRQRADQILRDCLRHPKESPSAMFFRFWGDNSFELASQDAKSTFSVDVDTASYALARRYLMENHLPEKAQIRTEEFVNYFSPDLASPTEGTFAIHTELAPSRYGQATDGQGTRWMLRVGLRAKDVAKADRKPLALTFVVDTSGSMRDGNRMELVKHALRLLVSQLDAADSIALVGFNDSASVHLPMTSAQSRDVIEAAIHALNSDGGTNAEGGLRLGYEVAANSLTSQAHNRVVLLSDGVANVGQVDQDRINQDVRTRRESGIFLNTIGVGMGNHNDTFLEQLANKGDGLCNYVDSAAEARRALVDNFVGAFEAVARDVKIQVEFDPSQVYRYRLLGYENRAIADADFRNDAVDAGEVGAGHQVLALYELELIGASSEAPLAKVNLRWKAATGAGRDPLEDSAQELSVAVQRNTGTAWEGSSLGYRRSVLVAQFAEILRRSRHARGDSLDALIADSRAIGALEQHDDFDEFVGLLERSRQLILQQGPVRTDLSDCIDALRTNRVLRAQLEDLQREESQALLEEMAKTNASLEARIRDLVREELKGQGR